MHIVASEQLGFSSSQHSLFGRQVSESLQYNNGSTSVSYQRNETQLFASRSQFQASAELKPQISTDALKRYADSLPATSTGADESELLDFSPDEEQLENLRMLLAALGRLSDELEQISPFKIARPEVATQDMAVAGTASNTPTQQAGISYDYHVQQWHEQKLDVSASGKVTTADGRTIEFNLDMQMQHRMYSSESVSFRAGQMKDPLVVNYAGQPVQLTGQNMQFDLDADGKQDAIAMLARGSAYLALDKNGNGRIDDGRELFGAITGDGFAELAAYDSDGNGFIDSADPVFKDLRLWIPDSKGGGQLLSLEDAGIGALGLMRAEGGFDLYAAGELKGQVRSTGMFLFEDGKAGSMQQIDLVV